MNLQESIRAQRELLTEQLGTAMVDIARRCAASMPDRAALEAALADAFPGLPWCKHLYVLDVNSVQVTDNITREGPDPAHFARDRSTRPYMQGIVGTTDFKLSDAYISRNKKRPSFTAVQVIRAPDGQRLGFLGADFDMRELPFAVADYQESDNWRQLRGDPAIRGGLFLQQRSDSAMDRALDRVLPIVNELMTERGVFHTKLYFSSSRASLWLADDPYNYRIVGIDELMNPAICLAYARRPMLERAIVPADRIMPVLETFRTLRFADDNIYLRSGSLNVVNGIVGLNFSCDGSHYLRWDEFLSKGTDFWFGTLSRGPATV